MTIKTPSTSRYPLVIGHRGASAHALENSLEAFRLAAAPGAWHCDGVELDIQTTLDGLILVHHDPNLSTGEQIALTPSKAIRSHRLSDGSSIPTLAEALDILRGLEVFIEAKGLPPDADDTLLSTIAAAGADVRCHVHAFDHRVIARLHEKDPSLSLGVLSSSYPVDPIRQVRDAGAGTLWQAAEMVDGLLATRCAEEGIALIAWTVNDTGEAARLTKLGVTGLCGDWPERLRM